MIKLISLHKSYDEIKAVDDINALFLDGERVAIIGANGAGKSTLLEIMMGLRRQTSGKVIIDDNEMKLNNNNLKNKIGVLLQDGSIYPKLKVKEILDLYSSYYYQTIDINELINDLHLEEVLKKNYKSLSGGWKQRVNLALAFINDPEILFLDEPTTGLDPQARKIMWDVIKKYCKNNNRTLLLSTHYMEEVEKNCDKVLILSNGKIVAFDTPQNLINSLPLNIKTLEDVYMYYAGNEGGRK